jgi:hypothetical protein
MPISLQNKQTIPLTKNSTWLMKVGAFQKYSQASAKIEPRIHQLGHGQLQHSSLLFAG